MTLSTISIGLALAGLLDPQDGCAPRQTARAPALLPGASALGASVIGAGGRPLGRVEDLVLHLASGRVTHAVIDSGGGVRAVPLDRVRWNGSEGQFETELGAQAFDQLPDFDVGLLEADERPDGWPVESAAYPSPRDDVLGEPPRGPSPFVLAGTLLASPVSARDGQLGPVVDLVLDARAGSAPFALIEHEGGRGPLIVPLGALRRVEGGGLAVDRSLAALADAPRLASRRPDALAALADPGLLARVHAFHETGDLAARTRARGCAP